MHSITMKVPLRAYLLFTATCSSARAFYNPHSPSSPSTFLNMSTTSPSTNLTQAKQLISKAISIGAPAYNAGDINKCATVYQDTAKEITSLGIPSALQSELLAEIDNNETSNDNAKAWALRRIFDSIVDYTLPLTPYSEPQIPSVTLEPFTQTQLPNEPLGVMDNVMGGISRGSWISKANTFFGETSLANNGGFASLRWRFPQKQNWSYAKGIYIKGLRHSKPMEHTFRIILKDDNCERVRLANYKVVFANPDQVQDQPLLIPFTEFDQMEQMGNSLVGSPSFNPMVVTEIGIMAIKPTVVGEFQLEFEEWGLYV
mmetsp:Transcript_25128/g.50296  ORF Transcript_25128/g.50296 Transcript_25128/m.50296 type:complete len:315 (+) Transcript_25128:50-994(+)